MVNPLRYAFVLLAVVAFVRYSPSEAQSLPGESTASSTTTDHPASAHSNAVTTEISNTSHSTTGHPNSSPAPEPTAKSNNVTEKLVDIKVYYEALCIDSVNFFKDQLKPTYDDYNKYINVSFIPFAQGTITRNSSDPSDKNTTLSCHRNATECDADKVHACAINKIKEEDKLVKFVTCAFVEGIKNKTVPIEKCGKESSINESIITSIIECSKGVESYPWLENYMNESKTAKVSFVPRIVIDKNYTQETQDLSLKNLKKVVCNKLPNVASCKTIVNGADSVVVGVLPMIVGIFYLIRMI